jgi:UDP-glucose 4-epimerase
MNILLTGGTGYIGSHTAVVLSSLGHQVVLYDNLSNSNEAVLDKLKHITGKKMPFVQADVRDVDALRHVLATHNFDAVIHFAGLKAVGESVQAPIDYYANNVAGTISLLQALQEHSVHRLVFSSSATVYGEPHYLPIDENHPTSASNPYGRTKLHIEEMLRDLAASDARWRIACLRYFNPVGAHSSGLIGENPNGVPNNLMPYIAQVATGLRKELRVFGGDYPTADGTGVRDYIHVMDLAQGHVAALNFLKDTLGWHALNLGTGQGYSVLEMVSAFEQASGQNVPYEVVARRAGDVAACYANPSKAFALMGWQGQCTLQDMCASAWNFQKSATPNPASN